jgi:outer membrane protein OmpA-like peptidoglycan-associated protein
VTTPYTLTRTGSTVTIAGSFPGEASRLEAVQAFKTAVGTGLVVVDRTTVVVGSAAVTPTQAAGLGAATPGVTDFAVTVSGSSLILTGTAISDAAKVAAENAVKAAFPTWAVTSSITVAAPEGCKALISQVASYLSGHKLEFSPTSPVLTPASKAAVVQVAKLLKTCPTAKVAVNGYTDSQGPDSTSLPLTRARAATVRDALVAAGVTNTITATGFGSANPVGDNKTTAGRAANRRVEIVIT